MLRIWDDVLLAIIEEDRAYNKKPQKRFLDHLPPEKHILLLFDFMRIVVWTRFARASFWNRFRSFHHEFATEFTNVASWFRLHYVLTVRVVGTRIEDAESSTSFLHLTVFAMVTLYACRFLFLLFFVLFDVLTLWVVVTCDEFSIASVAFDEFAVRALRTFSSK